MVRIISTVLILSFFVVTARGQVVALKVGPVFSKLEYHNSMAHSTSFEDGYTGFATIAGIHYFLKKYFCLSTDLGYINSGGKGKTIIFDPYNPGDMHEVEIKTNLHYITFNTVAHFKILLGKHFEPFIGLGPRVDYLVGYSEDAKLMKQFEDAGELNKVVYGLVGVFGLHYELHKWVLGIEYQYFYDMNELVNYTSEYEVENELGLLCSPLLLTVGFNLSSHHE